MKKALVLALMVVLSLGLAAFAGPYFSIENTGLELAPEFTFGIDFVEPYIGTTGMTFEGDFYVINEDLFAYQRLWICGFDLTFDWPEVDFGFSMYFELDPSKYPKKTVIDVWDTTLLATGKPSDLVTLWGGFNLPFKPKKVAWGFEPIFGVEVHW